MTSQDDSGSRQRSPRWVERLVVLEGAVSTLARFSAQREYSDLERGGLINQFQHCYELSWKCLKDWLLTKDVEANNPRDAIRAGFENGLFEDGESWMRMHRNRVHYVHAYDEAQAQEAVTAIKVVFLPLFQGLVRELKRRAGS